MTRLILFFLAPPHLAAIRPHDIPPRGERQPLTVSEEEEEEEESDGGIDLLKHAERAEVFVKEGAAAV